MEGCVCIQTLTVRAHLGGKEISVKQVGINIKSVLHLCTSLHIQQYAMKDFVRITGPVPFQTPTVFVLKSGKETDAKQVIECSITD